MRDFIVALSLSCHDVKVGHSYVKRFTVHFTDVMPNEVVNIDEEKTWRHKLAMP